MVSGRIRLAKSESIGVLRIGAFGYSDWLCAASTKPANTSERGLWEGRTSATRC